MKKPGRSKQIQGSGCGDREATGWEVSLGIGGWNFSRSILRRHGIFRGMNRLEPLAFLKLWRQAALNPERRIESKQIMYQVRIQLVLTCIQFSSSVWFKPGSARGNLIAKERRPAATLLRKQVERSTLRFIQSRMTPGDGIQNKYGFVNIRYSISNWNPVSRNNGLVAIEAQDLGLPWVLHHIQNRTIYLPLKWSRQRETDAGVINVLNRVKLTPDTVMPREKIHIGLHSIRYFARSMGVSPLKKANNKMQSWFTSEGNTGSLKPHVRITRIDSKFNIVPPATSFGKPRAGIVGVRNHRINETVPTEESELSLAPGCILLKNTILNTTWDEDNELGKPGAAPSTLRLIQSRVTPGAILKNVQSRLKLTLDTITSRIRKIYTAIRIGRVRASIVGGIDHQLYDPLPAQDLAFVVVPPQVQNRIIYLPLQWSRQGATDIGIKNVQRLVKFIPDTVTGRERTIRQIFRKYQHPMENQTGRGPGIYPELNLISGAEIGPPTTGFGRMRAGIVGGVNHQLYGRLPAQDLTFVVVPPLLQNRNIDLQLQWSRQRATDLGIKNVQHLVKLTPDMVTGRERTIRQILRKYQRPEENQTGKRPGIYPESNPIRDLEIVSPAKWPTVEGVIKDESAATRERLTLEPSVGKQISVRSGLMERAGNEGNGLAKPMATLRHLITDTEIQNVQNRVKFLLAVDSRLKEAESRFFEAGARREWMRGRIFGKYRGSGKNQAPAPRGRLIKIDIHTAIRRCKLGQTWQVGNPPEGAIPKPPGDQFAGSRLEHRAGLPDLMFQPPGLHFKQEKRPETPAVEGKRFEPIDEADLASRITVKVAQNLARELPGQSLNVIASKVYQMIEQRLVIEKDWRGSNQ
ncbi:MAG TPA: hypothetical protein VHY08_22285 [Bacillota bacterium]|nr:hypothetical protein [Bacillota bacterium]